MRPGTSIAIAALMLVIIGAAVIQLVQAGR